MIINLGIGLFFSGLVVSWALFKRHLTNSGAISALILGSLIYGFGGIILWSILIIFFLSSSLLSSKKYKNKQPRNYLQVISKGLMVLIFSFLYYLFSNEIFLISAVVVIASANADTWGSEIGFRFTNSSYSILNFKKTKHGLSGSVTIIGTIAAVIGSVLISLLYSSYYLIIGNAAAFKYFWLIVVLGVFGSLIDSYLGAIFQVKYKSLKNGKIYEQVDQRYQPLIKTSGFKFINNNVVNLVSTAIIGVVTLLILLI